jgi:hypothetical protein
MQRPQLSIRNCTLVINLTLLEHPGYVDPDVRLAIPLEHPFGDTQEGSPRGIPGMSQGDLPGDPLLDPLGDLLRGFLAASSRVIPCGPLRKSHQETEGIHKRMPQGMPLEIRQ